MPNLFKTIGRIRIRDILFGGFIHPEARIHACIVGVLLADNWYYINSYKGSDEIGVGCEMCVHIVARARIYGPFQYDALLHCVSGKQQYEQLIITEILLAEIAYPCVKEVCERRNRPSLFTHLSPMKSLVLNWIWSSPTA